MNMFGKPKNAGEKETVLIGGWHPPDACELALLLTGDVI